MGREPKNFLSAAWWHPRTCARKNGGWPRGGKIKFSHLQLGTTVHDWQGRADHVDLFRRADPFLPRIQFFYMVSRKPLDLPVCGPTSVRPATRMPTVGVAEFLAWWINPETGLPIPERGPACCAITSGSRGGSLGPIGRKT